MISAAFAVEMARYNAWQNANLYGAAETLTDADRRAERGAFFGSIHATLAHILWADRMWLSRFTDAPPPPRDTVRPGVLDLDWAGLRAGRAETDDALSRWADTLTDDDLSGAFSWTSGRTGAMSKPAGRVVAHIFNHQTHHRGQVHAMLTAADAWPSVTDLAWLPDP